MTQTAKPAVRHGVRPPRTHHDQRWELFCHDADIGVRGEGHSIETAFEQAAYALTGVIADPETIEPRQAVDVACVFGPGGLLRAWSGAM